jgi:predicted transcriptional regulator
MNLIMINIRIDPRMKQAIEKVAKKEFSTVSGIIKKAVQEYMEKQGTDWEKEKVPSKTKE